MVNRLKPQGSLLVVSNMFLFIYFINLFSGVRLKFCEDSLVLTITNIAIIRTFVRENQQKELAIEIIATA